LQLLEQKLPPEKYKIISQAGLTNEMYRDILSLKQMEKVEN
jgi:hypothetical protein